MQVFSNYPLKSLNTFKMDVYAEHFVSVKSIEELQHVVTTMKHEYSGVFLLGGGSNMLLTKNVEGLVVKMDIDGIERKEIDEQTVLVKSGAGIIWHDLVLYSVANGLGGIENLSLIPGKVGAAPIQNIGAYGVEIKDSFYELDAMNIRTGEMETFNIEQCRFGYRNSVFKQALKNKFAICNVTFRLQTNPTFNLSYGAITSQLEADGIEKASLRSVSNAIIKIRQSKLPDPEQLGNAGSFFKNPEVESGDFESLIKEFPSIVHFPGSQDKIKLSAGWLIEQCGWKGKRMKNCGSYEKQALVLVNYGNAKGNEVVDLAHQIIDSVKKKFNVDLEPEVNII